jgi:CubicO group peptidase (beta-lactamase class C family)
MKTALALLAGILFAPVPALGDPVARQAVLEALPRLATLAEDAIHRGDVPGLAIAVVHADEVVYLAGFGVREAGGSAPIGSDTVFPIASVSKPIAATVVAALVSDGVVDWDAPVRALDPSFRFYDPYVTNEVSVRDLFSHRSGLPGDAGNDLEMIGYDRKYILDHLHLLAPTGGFRSRFAYSNFGLTAAAAAAARATRKPWEDVAGEFYRRLGMTRTSSRFADLVMEPNRASPHTLIDGGWRPAPMRSKDAQSPAGGVGSTVRDLATWMRVLLGEGSLDGTQFIAVDALAETQQPAIYRGKHPLTGRDAYYGLGWFIDSDDFGLHLSHNGAFTSGIRAFVDLMPEAELGIVVLANAYPSGVPEGLAASFYDLVFSKELRDDWMQTYNTILTDGFRQFIHALSVEASAPAADRTEALPFDSYVGSYANDYVGEAGVLVDGDGLVIALGPERRTRYRLNHVDRDAFYIVPAEETPDLHLPVLFTIGPDGKAREVQIALIGGKPHTHLLRTGEPPQAAE